jgi:ABC-type transport system involved in multi-copper enzyme maturation permease subunit
LFGVGFLVSQLTFIKAERILFDFGMFAVDFSCAVIAIFMGAGLLIKEFDRRTAYVALSHPISRMQFIFGKFSGLVFVLFLNWLFLVGTMFLILRLATDDLSQYVHVTFVYAALLFFAQSILLSSIVMFFSTWSTVSLSIMMTIGLYMIGNNVTHLRAVAQNSKDEWVRNLLNSLASIVPNFEHFNLGLKVTYGITVSARFFIFSLFYAVILTAIALLLSGFFVHRKEI